MRRLIVSEFISLDGVIEDPMWTFPYWNDEIGQFKHDELFAVDDLLLGRVTYEGFAASWPQRKDEGDGYTDRINTMPKHVATKTLDKLEWANSRPIKDDLAAEVGALKQADGQDILVFGSGRLSQFLLDENLVDQYTLLIYPVVLGKGKRLFNEEGAAKLRLVESQQFSSGVIALIYEAAGSEPA